MCVILRQFCVYNIEILLIRNAQFTASGDFIVFREKKKLRNISEINAKTLFEGHLFGSRKTST